MKTKTTAIFLFFIMSIGYGYAQEKSKKQIKEEQKIEKRKQTEGLVDAKTFVFVARTALPQGYKSINLTSDWYQVKFSPDTIVSYLPYYGKAYNGVGYGNDTGLKFEGLPADYNLTIGKKNYSISVTVKGSDDTYQLYLTVSFEGRANLIVNSNKRSSISFQGDIIPVKTPAETPVEKK